MNTEHLKRLVLERYQPPEWAIIYELNKGVGWKGTEGRIDVAAFNCWPSKGHMRMAFELKRSRGDFQRELQRPKKRAWVEANFHETYFVVPHKLVKEHEVPESWGLLVATKKGDKLIKRKMATPREVPPLPEGLALSAIRQLSEQMLEADRRHYYFEGVTLLTQAMIDRRVKAEVARLTAKEREIVQQMQNAALEIQNEAQAYAQEMQAPLAKLGELVGQWYRQRFRRPRHERNYFMTEVTVEDVEKWAEDLKAKALETLLDDAVKARDGLDKLLAAAAVEGFKPKGWS